MEMMQGRTAAAAATKSNLAECFSLCQRWRWRWRLELTREHVTELPAHIVVAPGDPTGAAGTALHSGLGHSAAATLSSK